MLCSVTLIVFRSFYIFSHKSLLVWFIYSGVLLTILLLIDNVIKISNVDAYNLFRSADLEQLYQQFSSAQRRTSLVVTVVVDILTRLLVSLLTWPLGWWGMACDWLIGLSVILWIGICLVVLTRKEVMSSPQWLRYTGM